MSYEKMANLIYRLHAQTMRGSLQWLETEEEGVYQLSFPNYAVRVSTRDSEMHSGLDFLVSIYNLEGKLIDEVSDQDMGEDMERAGASAFMTMRELYDEARRSAMGVQQALMEIMKNLEIM